MDYVSELQIELRQLYSQNMLLKDENRMLKYSRVVFAFVFLLIGFAAGFMLAYIGV